MAVKRGITELEVFLYLGVCVLLNTFVWSMMLLMSLNVIYLLQSRTIKPITYTYAGELGAYSAAQWHFHHGEI